MEDALDLLELRLAVDPIYLDKDRMVTIDREAGVNSSGNLLMHTGHYYTLLKEGEVNEPEDSVDFHEIVRSTQVEGYPGVFHRNPHKTEERQAHDDYIAIMAASFHIGDSVIAAQVIDHGSKHNWVFNNLNPEDSDISRSHDRFPGLITYYRMCAKIKTSMWENILLASMILKNAFSIPSKEEITPEWFNDRRPIYPDGSDGRIHTYLKITVARKCSWVCSLAGMIWFWNIRRKWGLVGKSWWRYYWDHPFCHTDPA